MEKQRRVVCPENEDLAEFMWKKRQEMADKPKGLSENIDMILHKAYSNICNSKTPIRTLKDFSQIKGVGKWILRLMQEFFVTDSGASEHEDLAKKGKKFKGTKRYVPQKNSVAYALLITLYRVTASGSDFMRKQELIDAAEASGLSRVPIAPEKGKGNPGQFGSSPRDWYSGWSCMKTLITKGLIVKSSCPAKYMLTEEGKEAARECLLRSGLVDSTENLTVTERLPNLDASITSDLEFARADVAEEVTLRSVSSSLPKKSIDVPPESLDREGFYFHHAEPKYLMLVYWIPETANTLPVNATHRVGIGAFVLNEKRELLVVQEKSGMFRGTGVWKFPTGVVDEGEDICDAAVREVKEETGIDTRFVEILAFRQSHKSFFEKSDLFFVCLLQPLSFDIQKQELEIEAAQWMSFEEYAAQHFVQKAELLKSIADICLAKRDGKYSGFSPDPTTTSFSNKKSYLYLNRQCPNSD